MNEYYKEHDVVKGYSIQKLIGEGRYGIVYLAENENQEKCVVKQLKNEMLKETSKKLFYEEKNLLKLNYPNFPRFITKFSENGREGYLLEYIEGENFEEILSKDDCQFKKSEIYEIGFKLLELVEILHSRNIVHRDIRPPNIIQKQNRELALIDFGLSRTMDTDRYVKDIDYWFVGDLLIRLNYCSYYKGLSEEERPWFLELELSPEEEILLKGLLGIGKKYQSALEIKRQIEKTINSL